MSPLIHADRRRHLQDLVQGSLTPQIPLLRPIVRDLKPTRFFSKEYVMTGRWNRCVALIERPRGQASEPWESIQNHADG